MPLQETPDFVNSLSLKVEIQQQNADVNPVLDRSSVSAWELFVSQWPITPSLHLYLVSSVFFLPTHRSGSGKYDSFLFALLDSLHQRLWRRWRLHEQPGAERELQHPGQQVNVTNVLTSLWWCFYAADLTCWQLSTGMLTLTLRDPWATVFHAEIAK